MRNVAARIAQALGLILAVVVLNFTLVHLAPGDAATTIAGASGAGDPELMAQVRAEYGLDKPFLNQLWNYVFQVVQGDLGDSYFFNESVVSLILDRMWPTLLLVGSALIFAVVGGTLIGTLTARNARSWSAPFVTVFSLAGYSMPVFWTGIMMIIIFASNLGWFPTGSMNDIDFDGGFVAKIVDTAHHLALPAFTLGSIYLAQYSRLSRSTTLELLQSDYIRTARAKGLEERVVVFKHGLRNGILPIVTIAGLQFGALLSGALLVETVFNWPGLGRLAFESILRRDTPVLLGILLMSAVLVILANLGTDLIYRLIDPRIRVGGVKSD